MASIVGYAAKWIVFQAVKYAKDLGKRAIDRLSTPNTTASQVSNVSQEILSNGAGTERAIPEQENAVLLLTAASEARRVESANQIAGEIRELKEGVARLQSEVTFLKRCTMVAGLAIASLGSIVALRH